MSATLVRSFVSLLWVFAVALSGCSKGEEAVFAPAQDELLLERSLVSSARMEVETGAAPKKAQAYSRRVRLAEQQDIVEVRAVTGPDSLLALFNGLRLAAKPDAQHAFRFTLDRQFLTAYRLAAEETGIEESQIAVRTGDRELWIPVFQYKVLAYGKVAGQFKPTDWANATHIRISGLSKDRLSVGAVSSDELARVFVRQKVDGEIFSRAELASELQINVERGELFQVLVDGAELLLVELVPLSALSPAERDLVLAQDSGAPVSSGLSRCGSELEAKLAAQNVLVADCVKVARYRLPVAHVEARRSAVDTDGTLSSRVEYAAQARANDSRLLRIARDPLMIGVLTANGDGTSFDFPDTRRSLKVAELKNQEFLFRRTLEDSPNSFDLTFAGTSGPLEIVRILFERNRVRIVRADPQLRSAGASRVDLADLMSLPAQYFREVSVDAQGNALARPRAVPTDPSHPDAVAYVAWEKNSVPPVSSPLNYYDLGQCFTAPSDVTVSEMDHRLLRPEGILNFSLNVTYASDAAADCAGILGAGYFERVQPTFTFKERVSLRKYVKGDETPLLDLPYEAQKRLGFGIFTFNKSSPNRYGNVGSDGTLASLPALFDLKGGRSIRYVLAGLPQEAELRGAIIQATREVITDWNAAFRKAFKGTAMERSSDVIELAVEGEAGISVGALGDLDTNHIYFISKRTSSGVIGLGGAHSNPRSGRVESASVFIYGGNILSFVESVRKLDAAKRQHVRQLSSPQIRVPAAPAADPGSPRVGSVRHEARPGLSSVQKIEALAKLPRRPEELAFYEAVHEAIQAGRLGDAAHSGKLFTRRLLQLMKGRSSPAELAQMELEARRAEALAGIQGRLERGHVCAHPAPEPRWSSGLAGVDTQKFSDVDLVVSIYKPTLAHELGHNFGLRHNFVGSFDQANWKFNPADPSPRDYSSIMDYLAADHENYDGLGPYDVAAIRAAYAGVLEKQDGTLADLASVKTELGLASWNGLSKDLIRSQLQAAPLRSFQFCSDEEAGQSPVCNRFDRGATPIDIVRAHAEDYRSLYLMTNFAGDRLRFTQRETGAYLGKVFSRFVAIRQFLEETIYLAAKRTDPAIVNQFAAAAYEAMKFFHSVIRTPDAPLMATEAERIAEVSADLGQGSPKAVRVERRWLKDIGFDSDSDRLRVRGVELDKVAALLLLTERQLGFPRYDAAQIRFSFPEFEKQIFRDSPSSLALPTVALLQEILKNQVQPQSVVLDSTGKTVGVIRLDSRFKVEATQMMRLYALMGAIVNQDVDGVEARDNPSRLFRVMSSFEPPASIRPIVRPGTDRSDPDVLKYWAPTDAAAAKGLVEHLLALDQLDSMEESIREEFKKVRTAATELEKAEMEVETVGRPVEEVGYLSGKFLSAKKSLDAVLGSLPVNVGTRTSEEILEVLEQITAVARALDQAKTQLKTRDYELLLELRQTQVGNLLRYNPALAAALQGAAVDGASEAGQPKHLPLLLASVSLDLERGAAFGNLETLNRLMVTLHPELRR